MRLIDADTLDDAFTELRFNKDMKLAHWGDRKDWCLHGKEIEKLIADAPTVDAAPVVHGKWIYNTDDFDPKIRCSCCNYNKPMIASDGGIPMVFSLPKYCEMCGALMDGKAK